MFVRLQYKNNKWCKPSFIKDLSIIKNKYNTPLTIFPCKIELTAVKTETLLKELGTYQRSEDLSWYTGKKINLFE